MIIHALRRLGLGADPQYRAAKRLTLITSMISGQQFWAERIRRPLLYDLFQLLRRVDAQAGQPYALGRASSPSEEPVRLGQRPSLMFASAAIAAITPTQDTYGYRIDINGFGL